MILVKDVKTKITNRLKELYNSNEISSLSKILFAHFLNYSSTQYLLNDQESLTDSQLEEFENAIERLYTHEPIQHITQACEFFGLPFRVNSNVLIPRPETEELISWVREKAQNPLKILDICTGSGCIAIALKSLFRDAEIEGWDISLQALITAKANSEINKLPVLFRQQDILQYTPQPENPADIIISNPPYIRESEKKLMQANVLDFEPHIALFVEDSDPLQFYTKIASIANKQLTPKGLLFFEINEAFAKETIEMLQDFGFIDIQLRKDINERDRMVMAKKGSDRC